MPGFSCQAGMVMSEGLKRDRLEQVGAIELPDIVMSAIGSRQYWVKSDAALHPRLQDYTSFGD